MKVAIVLCLLLAVACQRNAPVSKKKLAQPIQNQTRAVDTERNEYDAVMKLGSDMSASIGNANDGSLLGGVPMPLRAPGLLFKSKHLNDARYGTAEVVQAILRAANSVHENLSGQALVVNDLSLATGGRIDHHNSHQSGRDVDVLFYLLDMDGAPTPPVGAFIDERGHAIDFRNLEDPADDVDLRLDLRRTWLLVASMIENRRAAIQRIFVAEHVEKLLHQYALSSGVDAQLLQRFTEISCQPSAPHDDHLHIRFYCAPDDIEKGCRDSPPMFAWRLSELRALGMTPLPTLPKRPQAKSMTVSASEARRNAGPMDTKVEAWLDRRQSWLKPSHSGRCRQPTDTF